jgi:hypothetical protein
MLKEFEDDGSQYFTSGRTNNLSDIAMTLGAVGGSLVTMVLTSVRAAPWMVASVAAIPAACASIQSKVDFRGRSNWYFESAARIRDLAIRLKYAEAPDLAEFARKRGELETAGEEKWKEIGRPKAHHQ